MAVIVSIILNFDTTSLFVYFMDSIYIEFMN